MLLTSGLTLRSSQLRAPCAFQIFRVVIVFLTLIWLSNGHVLVASAYPPGQLCLPLFYYVTMVALIVASILFTVFVL